MQLHVRETKLYEQQQLLRTAQHSEGEALQNQEASIYEARFGNFTLAARNV